MALFSKKPDNKVFEPLKVPENFSSVSFSPPQPVEKSTEEIFIKLAKLAEPAALLKGDELYDLAKEQHALDVFGYQFECSRWGNWLRISVHREINGKDHLSYGYRGYPEDFSTAINLDLVTHCELKEGHGPNRDGVLTYDFNQVSSDGTQTSSGRSQLAPGYAWVVDPNYPTISNNRPVFYVAPPLGSKTVYSSFYGNYQ